ncbi:MAG: hypothetical protein WCO71_11880 [Pseudomonadota bacterium]|jgi:hypothetical protein
MAFPIRFVTVAPGGHSHAFFMAPHGRKDDLPHGICYSFDEAGKARIVWRVKGWYSFPEDLFLGKTGDMLARIVSYSDKRPQGDSPLLEFYLKGKLHRRILTKEIIKHPEKVVPSSFPGPQIYEFFWRGDYPKLVAYGDLMPYPGFRDSDEFNIALDYYVLVFRTIENVWFAFDLKDGSLLQRWIPPE